LRGSIIPVIDIRIRFHKAVKEYNERTCIIVANISGKHVGFIVDAVDEVTSIKVDDIAETPEMASEGSNRYVTGIGKLEKNVVLLLDANKIIRADEMELLSTSTKEAEVTKI
jgi:purine-binding chemotaxis protein CheW